MQVISADKPRSAINVTPLVDVVLVLLIIFMVVVPRLEAGPAVQLPGTDRPPEKTEDAGRVVVAVERSGAIWIDDESLSLADLPEALRRTAQERGDARVVIKADALLTFGDVQQVMLAVVEAGFPDVGLIAERLSDRPQEG